MDFESIYNDQENYPRIKDVADALDISERTVRRKAQKFRDEGVSIIDRSKPFQQQEQPDAKEEVPETLEEKARSARLKEENKRLKTELKNAYTKVADHHELSELIHEVKNTKFNVSPNWLTSKNVDVTGIPVLFLSDIHFDEVVHPNQVGGVNQYNRVVAEDRIKHTFDTAVKLLNGMNNAKYEGIVCALGGDLVSGSIHDELSETNNAPILQTVVRLVEILAEGIEQLADHFGKVYAPCVVGNHGRLHHKPRMKNKVFENYEWLVYQFLAKHFENDSRVTFHISDGADVSFSIYGTRFLLEHGDNYRGGNGISGIFSALMLGAHRKNKQQSTIGNSFDVLMLGHFHQYVHMNSIIVNGSIKGYDEYAYNKTFAVEPPQQALFVVHPEHGITYRMPVVCENKDNSGGNNTAFTV